MKRVVLFLLVLTLVSANTFAGTKTWNNASGGNWNVDSNWTPSGVPIGTDTVYITAPGDYVVTYNANNTFVAAIYLGAPSGTQTLRNPGNVNGVTGSLTIGANGVFQMTSGTYSSSSVINYGTVRLIGGSFTFAPKIVNYDSVYISGTTVNISGGLTNYDSVFVASGTFNLSGTDTAYAGKYLVSSGATLNFNAGTHTLDANSTISGAGNVTFNTAVTMSGTYNITGTTTASAGTLLFNGSAGTLLNIGSTLTMNGGSVQVLSGDSLILTNATLGSTASTLLVKAPIRFTTSFTMNQGVLRTTDSTIKLIVGAGQTLSVNPNSTLRWQRITVQNNGTIDYGGSAVLTLDSGTVINNYGLFDCKNTSFPSLDHNSGAVLSRLNNYGIFRRSVNTTNYTVDVDFYSYSGSTVDLDTGTTSFTRALVFTDADATISLGATLQFNGTSSSFDANSSITGAGNVTSNAATTNTVTGTYNITGTTTASAGTLLFNGSAGTLLNIGSTLTMNGGSVQVLSGDSLILTNATLGSTASTLLVKAPIRFTTSFTMNQGVLRTTDSTTKLIVGAGQTLTVNPSSTLRWQRITVQNNGTIDYGGSAVLTLDSGTVINNYGLFDCKNTSLPSLDHNQGAVVSRLNNYGTFRRSVNATNYTVDVDFYSYSGSIVDLDTGTTYFTRALVSTDADVTISLGATLQFNGTSSSFDANSSITGLGRVIWTAGTATVNALYTVDSTSFAGANVTINNISDYISDGISVTAGTVNLNTVAPLYLNFFNLTAGSTVNWNLGGALNLDTMVQTTGTMTFTGASSDTVSAKLLSFSGGTLTGSSHIKITRMFNWAGGTHSATDSTVTTTIVDSARFTTGTKTLVKRTLINKKYIQWTGGHWDNNTGAIFRNEAGAVFDAQANNFWFNYFGAAPAPLFLNYGTLRQSSGTLQSNLGVPSIHTNATIDILSGVFNFAANATYINTDISVTNGRTLVFSSGTQTLDSLSTLTGTGIIRFTAGTYTFNGLYNISDSTEIGAPVTFNGTVPSLGSRVGISANTTFNNKDSLIVRKLTISGGTSSFNMGDSILVDTLRQTNGIITGNAPIRVSKLYDWSGGYLYGSNPSIVLINNGTMNVTTNTKQVQNRTIINENLVAWSGAHWDWDFGAVFINRPGALVNITGDWWWNNYPNSGTDPFIYNYGTIRKSAGSGVSVINISRYDSNAAIEAQSGALAFGSTASHTMNYVNTDMTLSNHAILQFNGGTQQLDANSDITGTGAVRVYNGKYFIGGIYNVSDSSLFGGNDTTFFTGGTNSLQNLGTKLRVESGIVNFINGDSIIVPTYWQLGGTLTGNSPIRVTSECRWEGGTIMASDSLVTMEIPAYTTLNMNGGLLYLAKRTFNIYANMNWNSGWYRVYSGAIINNYGTWDHRVNNNIEWVGGSLPYFNNYGTYIKSTNATNNFIDIGFNTTNSIVQIKKGTLNINNMSNAVQTRFIIDSAATLQWDGYLRTHTLDSLSSITGAGNMAFYSGTTNMKDTINISGETFVWGGTANFMGPQGTLKSLGKKLTLGNAAAYFYGDSLIIDSLVTSGTLGGTAPIYINSKFVLNGGTVVSTDSSATVTIPVGATFYWSGTGTFQRRTFNNYGTAIWTNPWGLDNNAVYNNMAGALTDWTVDGNSNWFSGTSNNFNNYGTFRKSGGTGTSSFEYYVNNYGLIQAQSGTINFFTSGKHAGGSFVLSTGSTIDFSGGNHSFDHSTSVTGTGTVLISPSTFNMDGVYNITGNTTISGGTVNFDSTFSTTNRLTISGGGVNFRMMSGHLLNVGNRLNLSGGSANFLTTDSLKVDTLLVNGTLNGNNHWYIRNYLQLTAGTITSPNRTLSVTLPVGSTFNWSGNGAVNQRTIFNYGTANWSSPWGFSDSTIYNNMPGAVTNLTTDYNSNWFFATGEPYLINYGTLNKSGGTGTSSFEYQISNYGTIKVDSGLTILCYDSLMNFSTGIITGKGTLDVSTRFTNAGTISPGASPGRLRVTGTLRNTNSAVYNAEIDTAAFPNRYDQLRISGTAALGGTLNLSLLNGYLPALNDSVKVMTYGSKTGTFNTINGLRTGGPYDFVPLYKDTALYLVASDSLNILPIANNDVITVSEDVTTNLPVLSNDVDSNGDGLSIVEILPGYPQHGAANIGSPDTTIVYTSALNYFGTDTLRYVIYDGRGGWDTASVRINVAAVNDRPVAKDTTASTNQFGVARVNVVATATDVENSPLVVSTVTKPKYGDAQVDATDTAVVYIPPVNFTGIDSFKYYVSDGSLTDSATVVVNVTSGDSFLVTWSNFNQSDEGWGNINDVSDSAWLATGGNPGGRFYAMDAVSGQWWYFVAPSKFLGDLSSSYDKTFRYDIKQNPNGLDNSQPDVILIGNGMQLNYDFPQNPRTTFTSFGLTLNETSGWRKQSGGQPPSKAEMQNVLANVTALRIRGEFAGGSDSASIDNVILGKIPGNNSPIANADDASTNEEVSVQITPLTNDTDPESQSISISAVGNAPNGNAVIDLGNLSITYKPDSNFAGVDSFAYYITDGYGGQDSAYIRVTVNNINDAPYVAKAISDTAFTEDFGKKFIAELDSVFRDVDNGPTFGATNLSAGVTPFISGDTLYVLSSAYFNGSVTIALSANDGQYTAVDTFMVTVSGVNNAPMLTAALRDTSFNEDFGTVFLAAMDSHFADVEGDSLVYSIEHLSGGIVAQILRDTLWLNSVSNFNTGPVFIRVEASDGSQSVSDTFSVFVTPVNDPVYLAVAISDMTLTEDFSKTFAARLDDHFGDLDGVKPVFTAAVLDSGVSTLISGDTLYVNSVTGFLGQATVRVVASDTLTTMADTFRVTVNPFNFSPVLSAAFRDTIFDEDFGRVFVTQTSGYFSDPDDATLTYSANILGGGASVQMQNDSLYVTSSLNFNGPMDIRVTASDGFNSVSDTFRITVQPVNDAPVMTASLADKTLLEDFGSYFVTRLSQVYNDPDYDSLAFSAANLDAGVDAIISGDSLYLHSTSGFLGQVRLRTAADDGQYAIADTFIVTVNPSNFPPTLADVLRDTSFSEDFGKVFVRSLSGAFADADDTSLTYGTASLSAGITSLVSNDSLYLNSGLDFNGTVNVRVYASDGVSTVSDTFSVTVTPVNDAPVRARVMADQTLLQDFGKIFGDRLSAVFSDIDNGSLTYTVTTLNAGVNGVISNDTLYLLSTTGFTGASTLRVTAGDGEFTAADTFVVNVNSSNTPPQILAALRDTTFAEDFGKVLVYKLGSTFTDADPLTFAAAALNAGLTVSVSNDSLYLTSQTNFNGTVSVRVTATDGAFTVPDTFIVTVSPVNDAPSSFTLIAPASGSVINVLRPVFRWNASRDIDGDALQYTLEISAQSNFSTLAQSYALADTVQTLTSDLDSAGTYYWRVTAADGHGGSVQTPALSFRTDAARPNLRISVLQGTVAKRYLDAYVYSNEDLSGAVNSVFTLKNRSGAVIDSRSTAMNRIGTSNLYSSSYHVTTEGNLEIQVTAQDLAGNQRVATRSYTVSALLKGETFAALAPEYELSLSKPSVSESGFIVVGSAKETETFAMPSLNAGVEIMGTTELRDAMKLTIHYDDASLIMRPDFDERKIGIYRTTESGFEYIGGQGHDHAVTVSIQSFGKYVVLYDESRTVIPDRIELAQNFPNPFNPTTTIRFGLVSGGKVKLVIYNVLGQRVRELVNDERAAGFHKVIWDGRNAAGQTIASGLYIYRLETPDGVLSRKMTFLK